MGGGFAAMLRAAAVCSTRDLHRDEQSDEVEDVENDPEQEDGSEPEMPRLTGFSSSLCGE